jgi:hypothetical protein
MGFGAKFRQAMRSFEDESRRMAKYTFAVGGAMYGGVGGAKAGYEFGSSLDDRKPQPQKTGTDLGKLRSEATANGFNPLTVLRSTGGQGFYRDQVPMGRLSSDAFFNAFDAYDNYKNKNTSTTEDINERSHFDIPLMINVFDDSGNVEDFKIINPELIEMSGQEITGSLGMLAAQYAAQHKVSIAKAKEILKNIIDNRRKNIGLEPVFPQSPKLETNVINRQSSFLDRLSHGFKTGNWIFPENKTPILQREPNYGEQINGVPINQQQKIMEELFP